MLRVLFSYRIGRVMEIEKMITKKEDLIGTEFKVTCKEEADLLKEKCKSLGIEHATWSSCSYTGGVMRGVVGKGLGTYHSCKLLFTDKPENSDSMDEFKSLRFVNIKDLKPRTKTEFVKCEYGNKVSNIVMDFENNVQLYKLVNDEYWTIDELDDLFQIILNDCYIYRKVETEIDERQEFIEECVSSIKSENSCDPMYYNDWFGQIYDSGKFKLVEK